MVKIDWIRIPRGKFFMGVSEKQIAALRTQVRAEAGMDELDDDKRDLVERVVEKFRLYRKGQLHLKYTGRKGWNLPPEENEIALDENFMQIIQVDAKLEYKKPQRVVELETFYIARFPITHEQCDEFFSTHARRLGLGDWRVGIRQGEPADFPEEARWHIANIFCHWVGGRLPTAAEWQKAARGRGQRLYPWGNKWDPSRGNFIERRDAPGRPAVARDTPTYKTPVDAYPDGASPYGVYDMVGNVAEWTMSIERAASGPDAYREGPIICGYPVRKSRHPYWFYNMVTQQTILSFDSRPMHIGFRPVKDKWQHKYWQGFQAVVD
jgi:formylglycine-generating enzyme required for sulfatase activity